MAAAQQSRLEIRGRLPQMGGTVQRDGLGRAQFVGGWITEVGLAIHPQGQALHGEAREILALGFQGDLSLAL